jgi:putative protease
MKKPEILAPAGGMESLVAAVRCGTDAVYMGAKNFNARRNAANFDDESFAQAVRYAHARGVKIYVTLNTLVFDSELDAVADEIAMLADCAVDGLIVQDLGVAALAALLCPALPLHASTQMTIHSAAGAQALEALGFARVVLARELSEKEIGQIGKQTSLELEVFVHGALCMSVSGQCYISAMLGERSGNRGLCAQPCRLGFISDAREYALSLRDLSLIPHMDRLQSLGVAALKLEGRMKRPEYVAAAVTACRAALEGRAPDMDALKAVFSRSGFTNGYFAARRDLSMFGSRTKEDVTAAAPVLARLAALYKDEMPLVPADMVLTLRTEQPAVLEATDGCHIVKAQGAVPEAAIRQPLSEELARRSLSKTGGTPFYLRDLKCDIESGLTLPVSALNRMRKEALDEMERRRGEREPLPFDRGAMPELSPAMHPARAPELRMRFRLYSQLSDEVTAAAAKVILPVEEISAHREAIPALGDKLIGELPLLVFPDTEEKLRGLLRELKEAGLTSVVAGNLGTLRMARELGFTVHGDYSLNILNSRALEAARGLELADATLSFEIGMKQAGRLAGEMPRGIIAYGHLPLMTFRNCPAKDAKGCGGCTGQSALTDRMNKRFPVVCRGRAYSQLLNGVPLVLADKQEQIAGLDFITLYFTTEDKEACVNVVRRFAEHTPATGEFTRGLYFRSLQ